MEPEHGHDIPKLAYRVERIEHRLDKAQLERSRLMVADRLGRFDRLEQTCRRQAKEIAILRAGLHDQADLLRRIQDELVRLREGYIKHVTQRHGTIDQGQEKVPPPSGQGESTAQEWDRVAADF